MKRTLEKLSNQRQQLEKELSEQIQSLQEKKSAFTAVLDNFKSLPALARLQESVEKAEETPKAARPSPRFGRKREQAEESPGTFNSDLAAALEEMTRALQSHVELNQQVFSTQMDLADVQNKLQAARDEEWDALGSNHVAMIFKSLEWRVDKLQASTEDSSLVMKTFIRMREQLESLRAALDKQELPTPALVRSVQQPLEDIAYAGFENRHRGSAQTVKQQQEIYLPYFQSEKTVLDLGCGRGEFLDFLAQKNIPCEGIDINQQMVAQCRERGHTCRAADILETLAAYPDGSLGGIFSSQVVEHLRPDYMRRLIDLAYTKLAAGSHIVLETLNPTSVFALVHVYFLDITHQQPIHPRALEFLLENAGFQEVEIRYSSPLEAEILETLPTTDENTAVQNRNLDKLNQLLYSPVNYAAIGRKA
jgi:O-antigen chain-terminating methyltransferase